LSDLAELYAILLVLYLFECCAWVPRRSVGLYCLAGRWRARRAWRPNPSWSRSVVFGTPWPPLTSPLLTDPLPFVLGPDGITLCDGGGFVPWEKAGPFAAVGKRLEGLAGQVVTLATRRGAAALAAGLEEVRQLSQQKRSAALGRLLDTRFDAREPGQRLALFNREVRFLRVSANLLWVCMFLGLAGVLAVGAPLLVLPLAFLALLLSGFNAVVFLRTLRKLSALPREWGPDRSKRLVAILSPVSSVRAADLIARELVGDLEPLAVAAALIPASTLAALARPHLATLRFQKLASPPGGQDDQRWWRDQVGQRVERVLRDRGLDPQALLAPPARDNSTVQAWCPSCLAQFGPGRNASGLCPGDTCPSIPLLLFD
jgi:hypothetical protein